MKWVAISVACSCAVVFFCGCAKHHQLPITVYNGSPWAEAELNGHKGIFLLDTGASTTVVDQELAQRAGITVVHREDALATTGRVSLEKGWAKSIILAEHEHTDRIVSIQNLGAFRAPGGRRQNGLIGSDFFLGYTVIFDRDSSVVELSSTRAPHRSGLKPFHLEMDSGVPTIQAFFPGSSDPVWVIVDTGSGYARERTVYFEMGGQQARRILGDILEQPPVETATVVSLASEEEFPIYEIGPVNILGRQLDKVRIVVNESSEGLFAKGDDILVSSSLLRQFSYVEIDYPGRRLWVSP
jgi:Aspartyl protease